jgi:hypothetical protein
MASNAVPPSTQYWTCPLGITGIVTDPEFICTRHIAPLYWKRTQYAFAPLTDAVIVGGVRTS